jgi:hypothetical protein
MESSVEAPSVPVKAEAMHADLALLGRLAPVCRSLLHPRVDFRWLTSRAVPDPASLVVVQWRSRPVNSGTGGELVMRSIDGRTINQEIVSAVRLRPSHR